MNNEETEALLIVFFVLLLYIMLGILNIYTFFGIFVNQTTQTNYNYCVSNLTVNAHGRQINGAGYYICRERAISECENLAYKLNNITSPDNNNDLILTCDLSKWETYTPSYCSKVYSIKDRCSS